MNNDLKKKISLKVLYILAISCIISMICGILLTSLIFYYFTS